MERARIRNEEAWILLIALKCDSKHPSLLETWFSQQLDGISSEEVIYY